MNYKKILPIIALSTLLFSSCRDEIMDWEKDPAKGEIEVSEIPLQLWEKIIRYDSLKSYTDLILGAGVGMTQYMDGGTYHDLAVQNFDDLTVGYAMKHGPMVNSSGDIVYGPVDAFIAKAKEDGMTVYGHTLVWHSNQNASYLNSLIAPTILPAPPGENLLDLTGLEDKSFTGWARNNVGDGITVEDNIGMLEGTQAVQLIASAASSDPWSLQLESPGVAIADTSHTYQVSFYIKSDAPGEGRISLKGVVNQYPWHDWYASGAEASESFVTDATWKQVKFSVNDFTGTEDFVFSFDLGYLPGITYYIDVDNIYIVDLDAGDNNLLANGGFENDLDSWTPTNVAGSVTIATGDTAFSGSKALKIVNTSDTPGDQWRTQVQSSFTGGEWTADFDYTISMWVKSEASGGFRISTTNLEEGNYDDVHYLANETTSASWQQYTYSITAVGYESGISLDFGGVPGTYFVDDIMVTQGDGGGAEPIVIEVPEEEKIARIGEAMENFITGMVSHYKNDIKAWDVVNEPMLENGEVRNGNVPEGDLADDHFYWQKYLGEEYAVTAFKLARQHGNPDDILFINDYNLESNMTKLDGLIQYVQEIESQGATVDGIGTQMHISYNSDTNLIIQMFEKLAASGKLIKITELDVRLGTSSPTASLLEDQANMYRFVIESYMNIIPEAQQYSITIWGISDNEDEHEYWLPEESPNLWDASYERKHAYKGAADGLAGRDVSEDFTGELDY